jgi:hypothetical protein
MAHQAVFPLGKQICLDGCLGVEARRVEIALAEVLSDMVNSGIITAVSIKDYM